MTQLLAITVILLALSNWGLWSRLHDVHKELFDLKYPDLQDKGLFAEYLGDANGEDLYPEHIRATKTRGKADD